MNIFRITSVTPGPRPGSVVVEYSFEVGEIEHTHRECFISAKVALQYLRQVARSQVLYQLENWVNHKRCIIRGNTLYTSRMSVVNGLAMLDDFITAAHRGQQPLERICKGILSGERYLRAILPHERNDSYRTSLERLNILLAWGAATHAGKTFELLPQTQETTAKAA